MRRAPTFKSLPRVPLGLSRKVHHARPVSNHPLFRRTTNGLKKNPVNSEPKGKAVPDKRQIGSIQRAKWFQIQKAKRCQKTAKTVPYKEQSGSKIQKTKRCQKTAKKVPSKSPGGSKTKAKDDPHNSGGSTEYNPRDGNDMVGK